MDTRIKVIRKDALFDERGALRGPWNPEVASPLLGRHLERLATAVRTENSLEANVYEVATLAVGVAWHAQFEWYAHERLARKRASRTGVAPHQGECASSAPRRVRRKELAAYTAGAGPDDASRTRLKSTKTALGGDRAVADLSLTIARYHGVSVPKVRVALPAGVRSRPRGRSFHVWPDAWRGEVPPPLPGRRKAPDAGASGPRVRMRLGHAAGRCDKEYSRPLQIYS